MEKIILQIKILKSFNPTNQGSDKSNALSPRTDLFPKPSDEGSWVKDGNTAGLCVVAGGIIDFAEAWGVGAIAGQKLSGPVVLPALQRRGPRAAKGAFRLT